MSKDFEQAYKELSQIEVPDLWDRIEAGLTERSTSKESETKIENEKDKKNKTIFLYMKRYSAVAAALLCVVIAVPVIFVMKQYGNKNYESTSESAQTAEAEEMYDMAQSYDAACDTGAGSPEDMSSMAGAEAVKEEVMEEAAEMVTEEEISEAATKDEAPSEEAANAETQPKQNAAADTDGSVKEKLRENKEGTVIENIVIEVTDIKDKSLEEETAQEAGTFYTALVKKDSTELLTEGEEIVIFIPCFVSTVLDKDGVYMLDIVYDENGNDFFTVKRCYGQIEE